MIEDFTNPHGGIKPTSIHYHGDAGKGKYRIRRMQGIHYVQVLVKRTKRRWFKVEDDSVWLTTVDYQTGKKAIFQTLPEAENFIQRCKSETIEYYY